MGIIRSAVRRVYQHKQYQYEGAQETERLLPIKFPETAEENGESSVQSVEPACVDDVCQPTTGITGSEAALRAKERMLQWPNPVEFVNNMYGSHPGDDKDYFRHVFGE